MTVVLRPQEPSVMWWWPALFLGVLPHRLGCALAPHGAREDPDAWGPPECGTNSQALVTPLPISSASLC